MIPESIWPGMFQAKAGNGNRTSVRITRDAISDTVGQLCHIRRTRGKKKGSGQPAMNRSKQGRYGY